jgi:hypothetical protein
MRTLCYISIACLLVVGCNRQQTATTASVTPPSDSVMIRNVLQKDSSIMAYIKSVNMIQQSVDTLMRQAKILKRHTEGHTDTDIISELRAIGQQMVKNQQTLVNLEVKLKKSNQSNDELVDLGENLAKELNEKDSEIGVMQQQLVKTKASLTKLTNQFNDSINVIMQERAQIGLMTTAKNTVFYIVGTESALKSKGIITDEGGVVGLGRVPVLSQDMTASGFTSTDLNNLHALTLNGSFVKMVTLHPERAYKVTSDKLIITDPEDFWSKSKYMVAIVR